MLHKMHNLQHSGCHHHFTHFGVRCVSSEACDEDTEDECTS